MKKIMALVLALFAFAAFSLVACQKKEEPKAPAPAGGEPAKEGAPAPAAPEAPAKK